jgi:hypothetical protein
MTTNFGFLAYASLVGVFLTSFVILFVKKPENACFTIIIASILFLPQRVGIKFPFVPPLTRESLPYVCLFLAYVARQPRWAARNRLGRGLDVLVLVMMVASVVTAALNPDFLSYGKYRPTTLPGLTVKDGLAMAGEDLLVAGMPFMLGRLLIRDEKTATRLLTVFAVGGLVYSLFIFVELRMSPQIHRWIYGYTPRPADFEQLMRSGGFRPTVFTTHPLALVMFMLNSVLAAFLLQRNRRKLLGWPWRPFAFYLFAVLILCKSTAAVVYALIAVPLVAFAKPRNQLRVAIVIAVIVISYPALRGSDLFPTRSLVSMATSALGPDRAQSLAFRFDNEDQLLDKAAKRKFFGWGPYGRNLVYDPNWGNNISVTDGEWIIHFGMRGVVGALLRFLLLVVPIWRALRAIRKVEDNHERVLLAGTTTMLAFSTLDLLPNAMFMNYPFLLAGAVVGMTRIFTAPKAEQVPSYAPAWEPNDEVVLRPMDVGGAGSASSRAQRSWFALLRIGRTCAGTPTAKAAEGTSLRTTALAPICASSPTTT